MEPIFVESKPSWKVWILWNLTKLSAYAFMVVCIGFGVQTVGLKALDWGTHRYNDVVRSLTKVEIIREVAPIKAIPLPQLVKQVSAEQGVPWVAMQAIADQESSGGKALFNFEPKKYQELSVKLKGKITDDEIRAMASSHGIAHVMGFNAEPQCGIHWSKLYDEYEGLTCGAKMLRKAIDRVGSVKDVGQKLWLAFKSYNGAGEAAENYANEVSARVMKLLFKQLNQEL